MSLLSETWCSGAGHHTRRMAPGSVITVLAAALLLGGCSREDASAPATGASRIADDTVPVAAASVTTHTLDTRRRWSGQLQPLRALPVQAPRHGQVLAVEVREGDRVSEGDVLVRIGGPDMQARRQVLDARREQLREQLGRWERLAEARAAGAAEVTEAQLRLLEVEEMLAEVDATLGTYTVRSPVSGVVAARLVDPAAMVSEGQALLQLEDVRSRGVRLVVPARDTAYLQHLDRLELLSDEDSPLRVQRIVYGEAQQRGFTTVELHVDGGSDARRMGVDVVYRAEEQVLVVPWTAIAGEDGRNWVALIEDDPPRVQRRDVTLGRAHPQGVEVLEGLVEGDRVVRYEPRSYPEGQRVEAVDGQP